MNKLLFSTLLAVLLGCSAADAQIGIMMGPRFGYGPRPRRRAPQQNQNLPKFQPSLNISLGYSFPNLDADQLPDFFNFYRGTSTQTGPFTGAIDYQFSRSSSIGILVTHGNVSVPYYSFGNSSGSPDMTGKLDNWAFMLDLVNYMPVSSRTISPYVRTAIGINTWTQTFTDGSGNPQNVNNTPSVLAYQVGLGAKFFLTKNSGLFIEAGYGKYILNAGLSFKF